MGWCGGLHLGEFCGLERTGFNGLYFRRVVVLKVLAGLKELNLTVSTLGGCSSLERSDFNSFHLERV